MGIKYHEYKIICFHSYISFFPGDTDENIPHSSCEPITVPLCQGIRYHSTTMPNSWGQQSQEEASTTMYNSWGQQSQEEAGRELHQFEPFIEIGCSPALKPFLCSLYVPECRNDGTQNPPSRSECVQATAGCAALMNQYGFVWPERWECSQFTDDSESESETDVVIPNSGLY